MKKRFLPKCWLWQNEFNERTHRIDCYIRLGKIMSSDIDGEIRDKVHILPCLCFSFNHSEVSVMFAWLNFSVQLFYKSWERADAYREKMIQQQWRNPKAQYEVGDTIEIIPTGKVLTIEAITDKYYDFGLDENGVHIMADLDFPEQYRLYKPSLMKRLKDYLNNEL